MIAHAHDPPMTSTSLNSLACHGHGGHVPPLHGTLAFEKHAGPSPDPRDPVVIEYPVSP